MSGAGEEEPRRRFGDSVVVITGGARGMGESHSRAFHREGASVVIADLLEQEGSALAQELGERALFVRHDVTSEADWESLVPAVERRWGPISVLVNNAGLGPVGIRLVDYELEEWRGVLEVNLVAQFLGLRAVVPSMRLAGGGSIVNIGSVVGTIGGGPGGTAYAASKWGVRGLTKTAAIELGADGIRVNAVHPGQVVTPMLEAARAAHGVAVAKSLPIPRPGTVEELSAMVLFLASSDSSYCTGGDFVVDGGMTSGPTGGFTDTGKSGD